MTNLKGKTAVVTGAGRNIGKQIALSFATAGANVVVCDIDAESANQTAEEIKALGVDALAAVFDVRDRENVNREISLAIAYFGKIDILVNNAGGSAGLLKKLSYFVDAEPETIDFVLDVNIKGTVHCTQAVLKSMIKQNYGKIITISSIAAVCGLQKRVDYAAAKAAQIGLTKALAMEVGQYNICVNCISPGAIDRNGRPQEHMTFLGDNGHSGVPQDIADTVLFLAGQDYITGQNIIVDGGRTLGTGPR